MIKQICIIGICLYSLALPGGATRAIERWREPPAEQRKPPLPDDFFQLAKDQLAELIARYPEVGYYWIDIPAAASPAQRQALYDLIKRLRPDTVVLHNHGAEKPSRPMTIANSQAAWPTDVLNTEIWPLQPGWFTPQQTWQGKSHLLGYEHCDKIGERWFWFEGDKPRPVEELAALRKKIRMIGGNLLLNVPPDRTGRIPEYHVKALMELKERLDDAAKVDRFLRPGMTMEEEPGAHHQALLIRCRQRDLYALPGSVR